MKAHTDNGTLYLVPEGNLVASSVENMRDFFMKELRQHTDAERIVLDVRDIDIVDSLGVNLIIGLYRQSLSESRSFGVTNAGDRFMKIANFFRFPSIFSIETGVER